MDIVLHIGAHRTATTSFQSYLHDHAEALEAQRVAVWGAKQTRAGIFSGLYDLPAGERVDDDGLSVAEQLNVLEKRGVTKLIISDENLMGSVRQNIREETLYPHVGSRVSHVVSVLGARVVQIVLSLRSLDTYWCSALAYGVARGAPVPSRSKLARIAACERTWRDVVQDVSAAAPGVELTIAPFEDFNWRPDAMLTSFGLTSPKPTGRAAVNQAPDLPTLRRLLRARQGDVTALPFGMGRWNPFTNAEHAAMREHYADDMMWLAGGASGMAKLTEDRHPDRAGLNPPRAAKCKGQTNELQERHVARPG